MVELAGHHVARFGICNVFCKCPVRVLLQHSNHCARTAVLMHAAVCVLLCSCAWCSCMVLCYLPVQVQSLGFSSSNNSDSSPSQQLRSAHSNAQSLLTPPPAAATWKLVPSRVCSSPICPAAATIRLTISCNVRRGTSRLYSAAISLGVWLSFAMCHTGLLRASPSSFTSDPPGTCRHSTHCSTHSTWARVGVTCSWVPVLSFEPAASSG